MVPGFLVLFVTLEEYLSLTDAMVITIFRKRARAAGFTTHQHDAVVTNLFLFSWGCPPNPQLILRMA